MGGEERKEWRNLPQLSVNGCLLLSLLQLVGTLLFAAAASLRYPIVRVNAMQQVEFYAKWSNHHVSQPVGYIYQ